MTTQLADAMNVREVVITSSPAPIPSAWSANSSASVPLATQIPYFGPDMIGKLRLELTAFLSRPVVHLARTKYRRHSLDFIGCEIRPR